jgi:hypothetical protein
MTGIAELRKLAKRLGRGHLGQVSGAEPDAHEDVPEGLGAGELGQAEVFHRLLGGDLREVGGPEIETAEHVPKLLGRSETSLPRRAAVGLFLS